MSADTDQSWCDRNPNSSRPWSRRQSDGKWLQQASELRLCPNLDFWFLVIAVSEGGDELLLRAGELFICGINSEAHADVPTAFIEAAPHCRPEVRSSASRLLSKQLLMHPRLLPWRGIRPGFDLKTRPGNKQFAEAGAANVGCYRGIHAAIGHAHVERNPYFRGADAAASCVRPEQVAERLDGLSRTELAERIRRQCINCLATDHVHAASVSELGPSLAVR